MKAYTDLEQSKKLAEILSLESTDMWYCPYPNDVDWYDEPNIGKAELLLNQLPCCSLAALLDVINTNYYTTLYHDGVAWNIDIIHHDNVKEKHSVYANTPIDACYEMILKLSEEKLL